MDETGLDRHLRSSGHKHTTQQLASDQVQLDQTVAVLENVTVAVGPWLNITSVNATKDGGLYTCLVINQAGADTDNAQLFVYAEIVEQPINQTARVDEDVAFVFRVESFPAPTYQWQQKTNAGFVSLTGENSRVLVFSPVEFGNFGEYRCIATTSVIMDKATSDTVALSGRSPVAKHK